MNIITITGIRPDFIRMSVIFKKFDAHFNHTLVHTGQHYDSLLSGVFFSDLDIRKPDYNLSIGGSGKEHFHQSAELSVKIIELIRNENLSPDLIVFLGDSNSVVCSVQLKKEGYNIAHIEAGMRSYDKRMLEEINRVVCDHCSDDLFVYHENYKNKAIREGINPESVHVVGNTIVEVARSIFNRLVDIPKTYKSILLDIHRPENFKYPDRLRNIIEAARHFSSYYNVPVEMLSFGRTVDEINKLGINMDGITPIPLMSYTNYISYIDDCVCLISDSGTAQEEPALFNVPVIVPRDYTERPESVIHNCSRMIDVNTTFNKTWFDATKYVDDVILGDVLIDPSWLGDGNTSEIIVKKIKEKYGK